MSVLVKGWSIPTNGCCDCYFRTGKYCGILRKNERVLEYAERYTRPDNCPLVEVPTPHGKLVDFDKFLKEYPQFVLIPASSLLLENEPVVEAEE